MDLTADLHLSPLWHQVVTSDKQQLAIYSLQVHARHDSDKLHVSISTSCPQGVPKTSHNPVATIYCIAI